jgi:hypothetical protein
MRRVGVAEWVLKRAAGEERGAAVYGDLVELATTRGSGWFRVAYVRTMVALTWRRVAAFAIGMASLRAMWWVYPIWFQYQVHYTSRVWQENMFVGRFAVVSGPFLNLISFCLWFALPFAWFAFGRKDRLTQFAGALFLATLPVYFHFWLIGVSSAAAIVVLLGAVFSSYWRRALAVLAVTCAIGVTAVTAAFRLLAVSSGREFRTYSPTAGAGWLATMLALALAALVCSALHRWLLRPRQPQGVAYA